MKRKGLACKISFLCFLLTAWLSGMAGAQERIETNEPPVITHVPVVTATRGQPIPVEAQVKDNTGDITSVSLFYALSQQAAPIEVPMKATGMNQYAGTIPANFFAQSKNVWYYIQAKDSFEDSAQTTWFPVEIQDQQEKEQPKQGLSKGTKIAIGAVAVAALVGGGIAIAANNSGGSDDDDAEGFDPTRAVDVTQSGASSGGFSTEPQDRTIDGSGAVAGRTITGIRATLNYEAFTIEDQFQIIYEGDVIADSGVVSGSGTIQGVAGGSSPIVIIRVITPSSDMMTVWEWNARIEYSVQ
jgi:hypothetical protein